MWDRPMLKNYAKQELKISYWLSFAVCIVAALLGVGGPGGSSGRNSSHSSVEMGAALVAFVFVALFVVFVSSPVEAGMKSFFIRAPYGDRRFSNLFSSFGGGRYIPIVKAMFVMYLYIFLWSLLLIVPGIIKAYQYRMVPYIISEDPSLTPEQALELSRRMTDGEKLDIFVLDLSFIGWFLLGAFAFGIGVFFVLPYYEATCVQLYFVLRQKVMGPPQQQP